MRDFRSFRSDDYTLERVRSLKGDKKLLVIFSTFGEREADLIYDKIRLLKERTGDIIDRIFLSHRRQGAARERTETRALDADPAAEIILCTSVSLPGMGDERGKGADMRRALHHIHSAYPEYDPCNTVIVFLDADVVKSFFGEHFVLGLAGPVLEGYDFIKAAFWREMGRVKKFVAQPLFSLVDHPAIRDIRNFAYPLSGEVAGTLEFFSQVPFWQIYGVETGMLIDVCMGNWRAAEVNLGRYDHEHHPDVNIQKMAFGVMRTFFLQLVSYGIITLERGVSISDSLAAPFIDAEGTRREADFNLLERKYIPLCEIWK